ncbi:hypothetical protein WR25_25030 [Diploscapter pachys]|uniref:CBS domain-containing protein n=1 Tax=Diploscapter pachys TaxID=2018661 RepID=A0A2A2JKF5_9BILA|nr:hypothetical protein WR25_25030 [Diploscapter pachys]
MNQAACRAPIQAQPKATINVYTKDIGTEIIEEDPRKRRNSGSVQRQPSILTGIRGLMHRPRSESLGAKLVKKKEQEMKKVQISNCNVETVYDLRTEEEIDDYADELGFRRPRSNSSDFLILRKTSRPLSVDVVGLVDANSDPYRQYMKVVDCYELCPQTGNVIVLDQHMRIDKAFAVLKEQGVGAGLIWDSKKLEIVSIVTLTDFLQYVKSRNENEPSKYIREILSGNQLVRVAANTKIFDACEEFHSNRVHRIAIVDGADSTDVLYLLTIKRVLQAIHKQNRSLHFALWLSLRIKEAGVGTWNDRIFTVTLTTTASEALNTMLGFRLSSLPVVDETGRAVGVVTKIDIARQIDLNANLKDWFEQTPVSALLTEEFTSFLFDTDPVGKVLDNLLSRRHQRCVFLVSPISGNPVACVSQSDVITHLLYAETPFSTPAPKT